MLVPDYGGGSIVNLMASLILGCGGEANVYPPLRELAPEEVGEHPQVVLLVVDGLGYRYLAARDNGCLRAHLRARMTSVFPSTTAAAVTTFLTGVAPQQHGLTGWNMYFRELGAVITVLPFRPRFGGASLANANIPPSALFDAVPVFKRIARDSVVVSPERIIDSDFNLMHTSGAERYAYATLPQFFQGIAQAVRRRGQRRYVYAYYPEIDRLAHTHGVASLEVSRHFDEFDRAFEAFLEDIRGTRTLVILTADHGFIDTTANTVIELSAHPPLADALMLPLCGERRVAYCYLHPHKREQFVQYAEQALGAYLHVVDSRRLIADGYFGLGVPHPRLHERVGHYTLLMKYNYAIKDWIVGEQPFSQVGMHGGLSEEELFVPLVVANA